MSLILLQLLNGVQYGLLLFLIASGLTLVFCILGVVNLAHGAFYMLGAYAALSLTAFTHDIFLALLCALPLAVALGVLLETVLIRFLYQRDPLQQVLLTFALIFIFNEVQQMIWGSHPHAIGVPAYLNWSLPLTDTLSYPAYRAALMLICIGLALGMMFVITRTKAGRLMRAAQDNREMVEVLGFDSRWIFKYVFALSTLLALAAGVLAAPIESAYPGMGDHMLILSFVVVVIGGIGSIRGAFIASLLIGLTDAFGKVFAPDYASILIYALMALVLIIRPFGLAGRG